MDQISAVLIGHRVQHARIFTLYVSICIICCVYNAKQSINHLEFKVLLCSFHNLVFAPIAYFLRSCLISVCPHQAMWQTVGEKVLRDCYFLRF